MAAGVDDGSEYTPDGQWIYFNSTRTGRMQIWKMKPDGSEQTLLRREVVSCNPDAGERLGRVRMREMLRPIRRGLLPRSEEEVRQRAVRGERDEAFA